MSPTRCSGQRLRTEEADGLAPAPAPVETKFKVSFAKSNREIECGSGQHVLDAAKKAGVRLAASCTQGMCGTCKVKLVSGEVEMKHAGGSVSAKSIRAWCCCAAASR